MEGPDPVGPRSWHWRRWYRIQFVLAIVIAVIAIFVLVNPGPGHNSPH
jgi:hypothetical protein